jgi:DNA-directed RNA polymerase subunit RPC12/RpoP
MRKPGNLGEVSVKEQSLLARMLVRKLDFIFQRYFHQSMQEIAREFEIRGPLARLTQSPEQLLRTIHSSQILRMNTAQPVVEASEALDRFCRGRFGVCDRCGRRIPPEVLEEDLLTTTCPQCQHEVTSKIYSTLMPTHLMPEDHDS